MKFDRLKASISNNADQTPSLYMILCMMESLVEDMEAGCGTEIGQCPMGDERLPTKLIWLSRIINEIYKNKSDELERNRARLDGAMEKLRQTQAELTGYSDAAKRLAAMQAEYAQLQSSLQEGQDMAQRCKELNDRCAQARQQLEQLRAFDPEKASRELSQLTAEISTRKEHQTALSEQLIAARQDADQLKQQLGALEAEHQQARQHVDTLTLQLEKERGAAAQLQEKAEAIDLECAALTANRERLAGELEEKTRQANDHRSEIDAFQEQKLAPVLCKLEAVRRELEGLEADRQKTAQELEQLSNARNELIMEIARQKETNETTAENVKSTQGKLDGLRAEKQELDTKLSGAVYELEKLQNEVEQLKNKKYPELMEHIDQEQQRRQELNGRIAQGEEELTALRGQILQMEDQLPKLEEELKNNREVYDSFTASCAASTKELESLERQIAELRNNNDREKVAIYRKQLEDNRRELEAIQAECARIQQENQQKLEQLEQAQKERDRLLEMKRKHEAGNEAAAKQLRELEFVATADYALEVAAITQRLELLERVRGKLSASVNKLRQILGEAPIDESASLEDQLKNDLRDLRLRADDLRCALVECANSLKLEER